MPEESLANGQGEIACSHFPFAEAILAARKNQSRSQGWLAREVRSAALEDGQRSGATRSTISRWESGEITPQPDSVRWMARALNLHVADLSAAAALQRELASARGSHPAAITVMRSGYMGEKAYLMLRRQFLNSVLAVAGLGAVSSIQASPPWSEDRVSSNLDEFVSPCESNISACWRLLRGSEVMVVPSMLVGSLPLLDAAASRLSEYRQQFARLATQGYIIAGIVTVLQGGDDRAEWCCKQAH
jgi:transcriptional regulator with XRE-family HTH domain